MLVYLHLIDHVYPFGGRNNDSEVPQAIDKVVGPFNLTKPIIFFQKQEVKYYVSLMQWHPVRV